MQVPLFFRRQLFQKLSPGCMIVPSGMVSLIKLASRHGSPELIGPGAVGGAKVAALIDVDVTSTASDVAVGLASTAVDVSAACAFCVSCAATVKATAVAIVSDSAFVLPQDVRSRAKSMRMDRNNLFPFLFIMPPIDYLLI